MGYYPGIGDYPQPFGPPWGPQGMPSVDPFGGMGGVFGGMDPGLAPGGDQLQDFLGGQRSEFDTPQGPIMPGDQMPGGQMGQQGQQQMDPMMRNILIASALGLGGLGLFGGLERLFAGAPTTRERVGGPSENETAAFQAAMARSQQSSDLLNTLSSMLLSGNLMLSPEIHSLVKQSFQNVVGDTIETAIDQARQRGFAGGAELLGTAAGPIFARLAAQIPGQMAQAKLGLGMQIPQLGAQLAQGGAQQAGILADLARAQAGTRGRTVTGPRPDLLQTLGPFLGASGQLLGGLGAIFGGGRGGGLFPGGNY